jgi:small subunit ribosomal protein S20
MANTKSAKKANRRTARRTVINTNRRSRLRSFVRAVELALAAGDAQKAREAFKAAEPVIMSSAGKGVIHKRTASRKISRLAQRVKVLSA